MALSVRTQLVVGFGILMLATLVTGVVSFAVLSRTTKHADEQLVRMAQTLAASERLRFRAERIVSEARGYLLTGSARYEGGLDVALRSFEEGVEDLAATDGASLDASLVDVRAAAHAYGEAIMALGPQRESPPEVEALTRRFDAVVRPARERFEGALEAFVRGQRAAADRQLANARHFTARAGLTVGLATAVALGLSLLLAAIVLNGLTKLFQHERAAAEHARNVAVAREEALALVAHDLRNPLTTVMAHAYLLRRKDGSAELEPGLEAIKAAAERMRRLLEQLLEAARLEAGHTHFNFAAARLDDVVAATVALFEGPANAGGVRLVRELPETPVPARLDADWVGRALSNLLANALKYTPRGGTITVSLAREGDDGTVRVTDTGPGIPESARSRLFERHWQAAGAREGFGLGLYIVRRVIEAHGGRIGVESELGVGTTFVVSLPALPAGSVDEPRPDDEGGAAHLH